jgi:hypothetical protein
LPLGFYCVTERSSNGKKTCKIISVCPTGASHEKNRLIQNGTIGKMKSVDDSFTTLL